MHSSLTHRFVDVNGVRLHIAEQGEGPLVLLLHGWPESWYSWRHQFGALAGAGYRVVAPDQRGYARSEQPADVTSYTLLHLVGDVIALIEELGEEQAILVGHDWGAPLRGPRQCCARTRSARWPDSVSRRFCPAGWSRPRSRAPSTARASTRSTSSGRESLTRSSPRTSRTPSAASWSAPQVTTPSARSPARWSYRRAWDSWTPCRNLPLSRPG
ncbi:alpha/beta hydrolase [Arthrobacter sp. UYCu712]|uniref:alpha/beta hydrolase n=1 Tax=Arthrobacter sp. UYCu712 TaxID=3156340 RepID=UPI003394F427